MTNEAIAAKQFFARVFRGAHHHGKFRQDGGQYQVSYYVAPSGVGHTDTRMLQVVYARLDVDQLRDLALGVRAVYAEPEDGAHQALRGPST